MPEELKDAASAPAGQPTAADIRAQLERILGSRCFEQAVRSSKFLRFVVEQTLAGQGERLKGYTIAVEVFGRPTDFDAQTDPLVRVEAGRVRRRLVEYYAGEGKLDTLRIELPRGSYAVACGYVAESPLRLAAVSASEGAQPSGSAALSTSRRRRQLRNRLIAALMLLVLVALVALVVQQWNAPPTRDYPTFAEALAGQGKPPIMVLPFEDLSSQANLRTLADTLTEEILLLLDEPELFAVATEPRAANTTLADLQARVSDTVGAAYVLTGSVRDTTEGVRVTARLVVAATGTQIWGAAFDEARRIQTSPADQERVAREIALVANPFGPIFEAELERVQRLPLEQLRTRDCVLKYYDYRRTLDPALHSATFACFEQATTREPALADAWAGLALGFADGFAYGYGALPAEGAAALDQAREAARTAMDIDGDNLFANLAFVRVQFFSGAEFQPAAERLLRSHPNSPEVLLLVGTMLVLTEDSTRGQPMLDRSIELTSKPPAGYYAAQALADLRAQRFDDAVAAALKIDSPNWHLGHMILAAAAALAGRPEVAERARLRLVELYPQIDEAGLSTVFERWRIEPVLRDELQRGLSAAGLNLP